jgi:hypothetical protein
MQTPGDVPLDGEHTGVFPAQTRRLNEVVQVCIVGVHLPARNLCLAGITSVAPDINSVNDESKWMPALVGRGFISVL